MSTMFYVMSCLFADDRCDEFGADCCTCVFYNEDDDEEVQEEKRFWEGEEDED